MPSQLLISPGLYQITVAAPSEIQFRLYGAAGGMGGTAKAASNGVPIPGNQGKRGARVDGTISVSGPATFYLSVGGKGGNGSSWDEDTNPSGVFAETLGGSVGSSAYYAASSAESLLDSWSGGRGGRGHQDAAGGGGGGGATVVFFYYTGAPGSYVSGSALVAAGGGGGGGAGRHGSASTRTDEATFLGNTISSFRSRGGAGQNLTPIGTEGGGAGGGGGGHFGGYGGTISVTPGKGGMDGANGGSRANTDITFQYPIDTYDASSQKEMASIINASDLGITTSNRDGTYGSGNGVAEVIWSNLDKISIRNLSTWTKPISIKHRSPGGWQDVTKVYYRVNNIWRQIYGPVDVTVASSLRIPINTTYSNISLASDVVLPTEAFEISPTEVNLNGQNGTFTLSIKGQSNSDVIIQYSGTDTETKKINSSGVIPSFTKILTPGSYRIVATFQFTGNSITRNVKVQELIPPPPPPPPPPTPAFTISPTSAPGPVSNLYESPIKLTLDSTPTTGNPDSFYWEFTDTDNKKTNSYSSTPSLDLSVPGTYKVKLEASRNISVPKSASIESQIFIYRKPDEVLTLPTRGIADIGFAFNVTGGRVYALGGKISYSWLDANGNTVTPTVGAETGLIDLDANGSYTKSGIKFSTPGTYTLRVKFEYKREDWAPNYIPKQSTDNVLSKTITIVSQESETTIDTYNVAMTATLPVTNGVFQYETPYSEYADKNEFSVTLTGLKNGTAASIEILDSNSRVLYTKGTNNVTGGTYTAGDFFLGGRGIYTIRVEVVTSTSTFLGVSTDKYETITKTIDVYNNEILGFTTTSTFISGPVLINQDFLLYATGGHPGTGTGAGAPSPFVYQILNSNEVPYGPKTNVAFGSGYITTPPSKEGTNVDGLLGNNIVNVSRTWISDRLTIDKAGSYIARFEFPTGKAAPNDKRIKDLTFTIGNPPPIEYKPELVITPEINAAYGSDSAVLVPNKRGFNLTVKGAQPNKAMNLRIFEAPNGVPDPSKVAYGPVQFTTTSAGKYDTPASIVLTKQNTYRVIVDLDPPSVSSFSLGEKQLFQNVDFVHDQVVLGPYESNSSTTTLASVQQDQHFYVKIFDGLPNDQFDYQWFFDNQAVTNKVRLQLNSNGNFVTGSGGSLSNAGTNTLKVDFVTPSFISGNTRYLSVNVTAKPVITYYTPTLVLSTTSILVGGNIAWQVKGAAPNSSITTSIKRKSDGAFVYGPTTVTADADGQWSSAVIAMPSYEYGTYIVTANVVYSSDNQKKDLTREFTTDYNEVVTGPFESNTATSTFTPIEDQFFFIKISGGRPNTAFTYRYWQGDTPITASGTGTLDASGNFNTGSGGSLGKAGNYVLKVNFDGTSHDRTLSISVNAKPVITYYTPVLNLGSLNIRILVGGNITWQVTNAAPNSSITTSIKRKSDGAFVYGPVPVTADSSGQWSSAVITMPSYEYGTYIVTANVVYSSDNQKKDLTREFITYYDASILGPVPSNESSTVFIPAEDQTFFIKISGGKPNAPFTYQYFLDGVASSSVGAGTLDASGNFNTGSGGSLGKAGTHKLKLTFSGLSTYDTQPSDKNIVIAAKPKPIVYNPTLSAPDCVKTGFPYTITLSNARPYHIASYELYDPAGVRRGNGNLISTNDLGSVSYGAEGIKTSSYGMWQIKVTTHSNSSGASTTLTDSIFSASESVTGPFRSNTDNSPYTPKVNEKFYVQVTGGQPNTTFSYQYMLGTEAGPAGTGTLDSAGNFLSGGGGSLGTAGTYNLTLTFNSRTDNNQVTIPIKIDPAPAPPPPPIVYPTPTVEILNEGGSVVTPTTFTQDGVTYSNVILEGSSAKFKFRVTGGYQNSAFSYSIYVLSIGGGGEMTSPVGSVEVVEYSSGSGNLVSGSYTSSLFDIPDTFVSLVLKFVGDKQVVNPILATSPVIQAPTIYQPVVSVPVDGNGNLYSLVNTNTTFKFKITGGKPSSTFNYYLHYIAGPYSQEGEAYYYSSLYDSELNLSLDSNGEYTLASQGFRTASYVGTYQARFTFADGVSVNSPQFSVSVPPLVAPVAGFAITNGNSTDAPLTVNFENKTTGTVTEYAWNFGDGTTSSATTPPAKVYNTAGTYNITLTAYNGSKSSTKTIQLKVTSAPVAVVTPITITLNKTVFIIAPTINGSDTFVVSAKGPANASVKRSYFKTDDPNYSNSSFNSITTKFDANGNLSGSANVSYLNPYRTSSITDVNTSDPAYIQGVGDYKLVIELLDGSGLSTEATFQMTAEKLDGGGGGCLAYGTKITMADGSVKNIEDVKIGQKVKTVSIEGVSTEEEAWIDWISDKFVTKPATATIKKVIFDSYKNYYLINGDLLTITFEHPVLVKRNNLYSFKKVKDVVVGDMLYTQDNKWINIDSIHFMNEPLKVVNIAVEEEDTYFANGVLTHNVAASGKT